MSMNLHSDEIELWQTPTWVTKIALNDHTGNKRDWKETRHIYIAWFKSTLNGSYRSAEELEIKRNIVNDHVKNLMSLEFIEFSEV